MSKPARILVIDDDESVRKALVAALEHEGYVVDSAESGSEAIRKSHENFYNLALIDIRLPDMEGTRLLSEMNETVPRMVKIIVTGYASLPNAIEALKRGADDYVMKPSNIENLLASVKERLRRQQEERKYSEEKVKEFIETRAREGLLE